MRSFSPRATVTTCFSGKIRSARWKTCGSVSGNDDIRPCMATNPPVRTRQVCRRVASGGQLVDAVGRFRSDPGAQRRVRHAGVDAGLAGLDAAVAEARRADELER